MSSKIIGRKNWERLSELEEYEAISRARLKHVVEVREPLVLISQIQRSGGTLLSQLFDGHAECHAHPQQLHIGYPSSRRWPPLAPYETDRCLSILFEKKAASHLRRGYRKSAGPDKEVFPFCFLPRLQHAIFEQCMASRHVAGDRDVLDCYFTSYFNAWLDNHNLYTGPKRVVTAFAPRLGERLESVEKLFAAYPDGTLISLVRDPRAWYASMQASPSLQHKWPDVPTAVAAWRLTVEAAMQAFERFGERVLLLTYEQLAGDPETTMAMVADRIGITMSPELLTPTFNNRPIRANSRARVEHGIVPERTTAYRSSLDPGTIEHIEQLAGDLYDRAARASS